MVMAFTWERGTPWGSVLGGFKRNFSRASAHRERGPNILGAPSSKAHTHVPRGHLNTRKKIPKLFSGASARGKICRSFFGSFFLSLHMRRKVLSTSLDYGHNTGLLSRKESEHHMEISDDEAASWNDFITPRGLSSQFLAGGGLVLFTH